MSEQDLRDSMREALWDEPPLNFDPDSFMERAEQLTRRRRALASVGVVTALLIATVATLPAVIMANKPKVDTATSSEAAPPSSTKELATMKWPPNDTPRQNHVFAEVQPQLLVVWQDYLSPALQHTGVSADSIGTWSPDFQGSSYARDNSVADVLRGAVVYTGPSGPAQLDVTIASPGAWASPPDELCRKFFSSANCTSTSQGDGSVIVVGEYLREAGDKKVPFDRSVFHYRPDGSVVMMKSSMPTSIPVDKADTSDRVPLSADQLTQLATNRGITLNPS